MNSILEILQGIPLNAVLREKISFIEMKHVEAEKQNAILQSQNAALQSENLALRSSNAQLAADNQQLKEQIQGLSHSFNLDKSKREILMTLSNASGSLLVAELTNLTGMDRTHVEYHLDDLVANDYVKKGKKQIDLSGMRAAYSLSQKGRDFIVRHSGL